MSGRMLATNRPQAGVGVVTSNGRSAVLPWVWGNNSFQTVRTLLALGRLMLRSRGTSL